MLGIVWLNDLQSRGTLTNFLSVKKSVENVGTGSTPSRGALGFSTFLLDAGICLYFN